MEKKAEKLKMEKKTLTRTLNFAKIVILALAFAWFKNLQKICMQ